MGTVTPYPSSLWEENTAKSAQLFCLVKPEEVAIGSCVQSSETPPVMAIIPDRSSSVVNSDLHEITSGQEDRDTTSIWATSLSYSLRLSLPPSLFFPLFSFHLGLSISLSLFFLRGRQNVYISSIPLQLS